MLGTQHLHINSGRPLPPPPRRTPRRKSSVCRTPKRRHNSAEIGLSASSKATRSDVYESRKAPVRGREESSDSTPGRPRAPEDVNFVRGRNMNERLPPSKSRRAVSSKNDRLEEWHTSTLAVDRERSSQTRWGRSDEIISQGSLVGRSHSPREGEFCDPQALTMRLRHSLSRGYSPQRGHPTQAVVGTELAPPMPRLQGAYGSSKNRYRKTIERFIECQPTDTQREMQSMLEEYRGRENELCEALSVAYSDSWESSVRGNDTIMQPHKNNNCSKYVLNESSSMPEMKDVPRLGNGKGHFDVMNNVECDHNATAEYHRQRMTKPTSSAHSTPSRCQDSHQNVDYLRSFSDFGTPHRSEGMNLSKSAEKERYDEDTSPHLRNRSSGGANAPLYLGSFLEQRETTPRSGGMLTPPIPADLLAR
ncbi:hypothetical protein MOQ_000184 [Trypanosoma cruzi marinkellei]|uniref:Uncharacterized protein n=1 Tax=Trypanosoma cruzi marinkellei TaxID=85056 RepID=K2NP34_TRYCR|nr:hypothetical protein MOQ_000184 [Trypanosoma cruzi marinkellei]